MPPKHNKTSRSKYTAIMYNWQDQDPNNLNEDQMSFLLANPESPPGIIELLCQKGTLPPASPSSLRLPRGP
jgi:hypothetical protein